MITELQVLMAVLFDTLLGEPKRWHPLAGFGWLAIRIESFFYPNKQQSVLEQRIRGMLAWCVIVLPFVLLAYILTRLENNISTGIEVLLLYFALGGRSLAQHAMAVANALMQNNIQQARYQIQMMVSRDTEQMQDSDISRATIESVLENGNDAIFGAIFWFLILGAPGVVLYRLANTLDAMWGYKNTRYHAFGWFAARTDDLLNWLPARLTAASYALVGNTRMALRCWKVQSNQWKGMNPGVVMSSGAGALGLTLGGEASYQGHTERRPILGEGNKPNALSIKKGIQLVQKSLWLWLVIVFIEGVFSLLIFN